MERQVLFRDYQEQISTDHNNIQEYVQEALDSICKDAISAARKFSGLNVSKTGQVEITVAPGKMYEAGAVYGRRTSLTQSMATYTAAAAKRIVTISAFGQTNETDVQTRDYLTNTATGEVEPRAVAMTSSRDLQLVFTAGAEAADPVPPAIPATHVIIANVLMDSTQVVSVTMVTDNEVVSTDQLDIRADSLEIFRAAIEPRVASLASDIADLANRMAEKSTNTKMNSVFLDLARLKEKLMFPDDASGYGANWFLDHTGSDMDDTAGLGFDAEVEMGIRFPYANANISEISLFSANDPNASNVGGLLLPKYTEILKVQTGAYASELGISQYGFQTHEMQQGYMSRSRLRYGGRYIQCSNGSYLDQPGQPVSTVGLYDFNTTELDIVSQINYLDSNTGYFHINNYRDTWWFDEWEEPFMYTVTTDHTITGAMVAQTFLVSNDMISTKLGFYITAKGANEDIHLALCEVTAGQPDLEKVILKTVYPQASIVNGWNRLPITPTFLAKGKRYALVFISNANHKIGMSSGQSYLDGTFFYSTDSIYYQGDLTKDMMIEVWGAKFNSAQVTIEFAPLNLDGGFRDIDILAEMWAPASTDLVFELRPNGTGEWMPLVEDNGATLAQAPPLCQFRARFVGTSDIAPMLHLTGSRVKVSRPKTAFKHVSTVIAVPALPNEANNVTVECLLEHFDETPHDFNLQLRVGSSYISPVTTVTKLEEPLKKRYRRTYTFSVAAGTTSFRFVETGTTTSSQNTFHVAERIYYTS